MSFDGYGPIPDTDPQETEEWLDSLDAVVERRGSHRARFVLNRVVNHATETIGFPRSLNTPYVNTIPPEAEPPYPGDEHLERLIRRYVRWNAAAMVVRANHKADGIGGHLATFASTATLYEVGFNHFFRGKDGAGLGDFVYFQGHAAPGVYARAYLEGRLSDEQLDNFRQEVGGRGLSSYPHPRLMPDFWEFPTVSMGIGPINAIYQARLNRYLANRGLVDTSDMRVWCFLGDGELDEPEAQAALCLAARERLDNLTFVVNCNLQRLDGPVRGNGKVIQELEALFRGAGWNVIKVIWGSAWDDLLARDVDGLLLEKMNQTVDGDFQRFTTESGSYIREHFFGPDPRLKALVAHLSDDELARLPRGGHDIHKVYAAYYYATQHKGSPTVILAKTVKGWKLGPEIEARNAAHQVKKMAPNQLTALRDRLQLFEEIPDEALQDEEPPYYRPPKGSEVYEYLMERRRALGGPLPKRVMRAKPLDPPEPATLAEFRKGSGNQAVSTTMAFARMLRNLARDKNVGQRIVPIVPDEARTFGLDSLFRELKIYAPFGQLYTPVDANLLLSYTEASDGRVLEEGITEAGCMASFTAAGTAKYTVGYHMVPIYMFYSMFGFQRTGDLNWAAADAGASGFLLGCTAGRTTLTGEGLQHDDGHSLLLYSVVPSAHVYDPAFAYEVAIILEDGIRRMYGPEPENCYYYITLYNENYIQPPMPEGEDAKRIEQGVIEGIYRFAPYPEIASPDGAPKASQARGRARRANQPGPSRKASILFSGTAWQAAMQAREILASEWNVAAEAWSVTSYKALREEALSAERWNRLHPGEPAKVPLVTRVLSESDGPFVAVTDYMKAVPDQVARWVPGQFVVLGTDGFGRSDTRPALRRHFEVDAAHIVVATLAALAERGDAKPEEVAEAIARYGIDPDAPDPRIA